MKLPIPGKTFEKDDLVYYCIGHLTVPWIIETQQTFYKGDHGEPQSFITPGCSGDLHFTLAELEDAEPEEKGVILLLDTYRGLQDVADIFENAAEATKYAQLHASELIEQFYN